MIYKFTKFHPVTYYYLLVNAISYNKQCKFYTGQVNFIFYLLPTIKDKKNVYHCINYIDIHSTLKKKLTLQQYKYSKFNHEPNRIIENILVKR